MWLQPMAPTVAGAAFRYLNSGMWAGPAGDVIAMLAVMTGAPTPGLMDYYLNWRPAASPGAPKTPRAFRENDQVLTLTLSLTPTLALTLTRWRTYAEMLGVLLLKAS